MQVVNIIIQRACHLCFFEPVSAGGACDIQPSQSNQTTFAVSAADATYSKSCCISSVGTRALHARLCPILFRCSCWVCSSLLGTGLCAFFRVAVGDLELTPCWIYIVRQHGGRKVRADSHSPTKQLLQSVVEISMERIAPVFQALDERVCLGRDNKALLLLLSHAVLQGKQM